MVTAKFSKRMYDAADAPAKRAITKYLFRTKGAIVEEHPMGKYGVDLLITYRNGKKVFLEIERKYVWEHGSFPYDTVHIPERKYKFCNLQYPTYFISFRKDLKEAVITRGTDLNEDILIEVSNKRVFRGERFFDVPKKLVKLIHLTIE